MKRLFFWVSTICLPMVLLSQSARYDYQWIFGYGSALESGFGLSILDFTSEGIQVYAVSEPGIDIGDAASMVCDRTTGELQLINTTCSILDITAFPISGGGVLIPGETHQTFCDQGLGYPTKQNSLLLPLNEAGDKYITFFRDQRIDFVNQTGLSDTLYAGFVSYDVVQGQYQLDENRRVYSEDVITDLLTATPGQSASEWWVFSIGHQSNEFIFHHVIDGDIDTLASQFIGPELSIEITNSAQIQFSPKNDLLAINSREGVLLYDFDPNNGQLSNFRQIDYPGSFYAQGLCFSPNGRLLYVNTFQDSLYQINLLTEEVTFIAHHASFSATGWPVGMGNMHIGPDCRIYVSPATTSNFLHVIHEPNKIGTACTFQPRAIETPTRLSHNMPYIPNFRAISPCDPSIAWTFDPPVSSREVAVELASWRVYPNPVDEVLRVERDVAGETIPMRLMNGLGQTVGDYTWRQGELQLLVPVLDLPAGLYYLVTEMERKAFVVD